MEQFQADLTSSTASWRHQHYPQPEYTQITSLSVNYKLATVIYNSLHSQLPSYLVDDCQPTAQSRCHQLCSVDTNDSHSVTFWWTRWQWLWQWVEKWRHSHLIVHPQKIARKMEKIVQNFWENCAKNDKICTKVARTCMVVVYKCKKSSNHIKFG